jgi:hypothetical protein
MNIGAELDRVAIGMGRQSRDREGGSKQTEEQNSLFHDGRLSIRYAQSP